MAMAMPATGTRARSATRCAADARVIWHPSPNIGLRRGGVCPDMIVLHYTAMVTVEAALERLCDPSAEVSAHYLICERGRLWHLVDEGARAWHAGAGQWGDVTDVNSRSIGIELANTGLHPFPEPQMRALEGLIVGIMARWSIPPARVIAHSDMAPARKCDPGPRFDWRRLARQGLSIWPAQGSEAAPEQFSHDAARFGYVRSEGVSEADILRAFRLRFRPHVTGPLDPQDCAMMADLAARFAVDRAAPSA
ncbi:N-acetylmuramoyl-L-alanine amidase AmiD [Roseovarius mucosus]|uniref:N-acetylmuramoyl-L-alanine amidase n=2 Tax=Roseovarius mucosus TaxID=215743 RepID=A0A1V0RST3_9RHOB|nr:N-acetylmuramoyl-L-alanine amidase AmiD [Roseovarius mucosus]